MQPKHSIQLRFNHRLAKKRGLQAKPLIASSHRRGGGRDVTERRYENCLSRWGHGAAFPLRHGQRVFGQSFLWTVVRDPTKRAVSHFYHFEVSRKNVPANHTNLRTLLMHPTLQDHYLKLLATNNTQIQNLERYRTGQRQLNHRTVVGEHSLLPAPVVTIIQSILNDYDFIGVTERMEETAVAFMMLLNGTVADILHLNAKVNGEYDDLCYKIQPPLLTPAMQRVLDSKAWHNQMKWDVLLYQLANQSLDETIRALGEEEFADKLNAFRAAQGVVHKTCGHLDVYPCTRHGKKRNPKRDCLWSDSACGFECINEVAQKLGLEQ